MSITSKKKYPARGRGSFSPTPMLAFYVASLTKPCYRSKGFSRSRLMLEWDSIVGSYMASLAQPCKILTKNLDKEKTLVLLVSSASAPEVMHHSPQLIETINTYFGMKSIHRIFLKHVSLGPKQSQETKTKTERESSSALYRPISGQQKLSLGPLLSDVKDEKLRNALESLGKVFFSG